MTHQKYGTRTDTYRYLPIRNGLKIKTFAESLYILLYKYCISNTYTIIRILTKMYAITSSNNYKI